MLACPEDDPGKGEERRMSMKIIELVCPITIAHKDE
jgi:hypothetical protein